MDRDGLVNVECSHITYFEAAKLPRYAIQESEERIQALQRAKQIGYRCPAQTERSSDGTA